MSQLDEMFPGPPAASEQSPTLKDPPQFEYLTAERAADGTTLYRPAPADSSVEESVMIVAGEFRDELLGYDSKTEGLDVARVDAFMTSFGLHSPACVYLEKDDSKISPELWGLLGVGGAPGGRVYRDLNGSYLELADVAAVIRDPELDRLNGPEFAESVAVHERAHGAFTYSDTVRVILGEDGEVLESDDALKVAQTGFLERTLPTSTDEESELVGTFWSEAFAELMRGYYVEHTRGAGGFTSYADGITVDVDGIPVPSKYLYAHREGEYTLDDPVYAAVGLEMLVNRDPELFPALLRFCSSKAALQEVKDRVNAFSPGLYEVVRDSYNGYETGESEGMFNHGASHIMRTLALSDDHK